MKKKSLFITFEGTDGVGKSTQIKALSAWLTSQGRRVVLTREPGGSPLSEKIRTLLLDPRQSITPKAELFLYEAARVEHVEKIVRPALKRGTIVLCDRYTDATSAYQGFARRLDMAMIKTLNTIATSSLSPDLTLWLDRAPKIALNRASARNGKGGDRLEREGVAFQHRVRAGYRALQKSHPSRIKRIPVQENPDATQKLIRLLVARKLK
jgi:dTMP kinase